jgi:hypothetical protein
MNVLHYDVQNEYPRHHGPYAAFSPPPETQHHQHPKDIQLSTTTIDTAVTNSSDAMLLATVL